MGELKLATAGDDIKLWDISSFELIKQYNPHGGNISSLYWSHDNSALASASTVGDKVVLSYVSAGFYTKDITIGDKVTCTTFNSNSRYVMGGSANGLIHVWDLKTQKLKKSYRDHKDAVTALYFNWNDTAIASGSHSGDIILYNVTLGTGCSPLIAPKVRAIRQIQYSHFNKSLLGAVSDDGGVNMWNTNTKQLMKSYSDAHRAPATGLVYSPVNEMLMISVGLDKHIVCYDVKGKTAVKTMNAESPLTSIDLMGDGTTLAVGSTRGKVYLYDLRAGDEPFKILTAHKSSVQSLKFQSNPSQTKNATDSAKPARRAMSNPAIQAKRAQFETPTNNNGKPLPRSNHDSSRETNGMTSAKSVPDIDGLNRGLSDRTNRVNFVESREERANPLAESTPFRGRDSDQSSGIVSPLRDTTSLNNKRDGSPYNNRDSLENHPDRFGLLDQPTGRISSEIFSPASNNLSSNRSNNNPATPVLDHLANPVTFSQRGLPSSSRRTPVSEAQEAKSRPKPMGNEENTSHFYKQAQLSPSSHSSESASQSSREAPRGRYGIKDTATLDSRDNPPRLLSEYYDGHNSGRLRSSSRSLSPAADVGPSGRSPASRGDLEPCLPPAENGAAGPDPSSGSISSFHTKFIRNMIEDAMDEFRDQIRRDVLNLHMDMLKQFQIQQMEVREMLQHYSVNEQLIAEIEHLKEENRRLKKKF